MWNSLQIKISSFGNKIIAKIRQRLMSVPLRIGLIFILVALVLAGLSASFLTLNDIMRSYLLSRVDSTLIHQAKAPILPSSHDSLHTDPVYPIQQMPMYLRLVNEQGNLVYEDIPVDTDDKPDLMSMQNYRLDKQLYIVISNRHDRSPWRILRIIGNTGTIYLGISLSQIQQTLDRLSHIEQWVAAIIMVIVAILGSAIIRIHLRPLKKAEFLALKIASGDMSIRMPYRPLNTEIGSLSHAFNTMLERIQESFELKDKSEAEMRHIANTSQQFLADASHELRTPLTSIRGFAELYRQGASTDVNWVLSRIEKESARMSAIVEDILTLARTGISAPVELTEVDVLEVVRDGVIAARAIAPNREINIKFMGDFIPIVMGVRQRLIQIISNYLSNAISYTPDGSGIDVQIESTVEQVIVSIIDQGPGVALEEQARIFERFYRTDISRARESGGSGLGLSIVSVFAESMGGRVGVESEVGHGARFWVSIPRIPDTCSIEESGNTPELMQS